MVNVFLAIIMDAYGQVMGHARLTGAATISDDYHRAMAVTFRSGLSKKLKKTITSERMKSVIQIAKHGDILHGITGECATAFHLSAFRCVSTVLVACFLCLSFADEAVRPAAAESLTDVEMRALKKAFIKHQPPEDDPIADLSKQMSTSNAERVVRMTMIERQLIAQGEMLEKLVVSTPPWS